MINCPSCEYADFEKDKCTRLLTRLPHICPYCEERKPRNHFERIKSMSMEELADWLVMNGCGCDYKTWLNWLKEEIADG